MAKATLIWVSRDGGTTRVLQIPRNVVLGLVGGFFGFLLASLAGFLWGAGLHARVEQEQATVLALEKDLASQVRSLDERQAEVLGARQQKEALEAEVLRIQDVDQKIRRLLGLNASDYDADTAHQGGLGTDERGARSLAEEDLSAAEAAPPVVASVGSPRTLHTSLQEVLSHLEDRREASRTYPMLLPVTSEEAWLSCSFGSRSSPFSPDAHGVPQRRGHRRSLEGPHPGSGRRQGDPGGQGPPAGQLHQARALCKDQDPVRPPGRRRPWSRGPG